MRQAPFTSNFNLSTWETLKFTPSFPGFTIKKIDSPPRIYQLYLASEVIMFVIFGRQPRQNFFATFLWSPGVESESVHVFDLLWKWRRFHKSPEPVLTVVARWENTPTTKMIKSYETFKLFPVSGCGTVLFRQHRSSPLYCKDFIRDGT